jgi:myosin heavy subunit
MVRLICLNRRMYSLSCPSGPVQKGWQEGNCNPEEGWSYQGCEGQTPVIISITCQLISIKADWKEGFKKKQVGVSDMTLLTTISNESVNDNLQKRWTSGEIYTYIGAVLISVNPFRGESLSHSHRVHAYSFR